MPICVVFVVITLVEATSLINSRTVALWVPMANRPSRLAAVTLAALGSESGAPINAVRRKPVSTAHSSPKSHASAARPRRSSITARLVVAAAASTKLPVTCATKSPYRARKVKLSRNPAVKLRSGGYDPWDAFPRGKHLVSHHTTPRRDAQSSRKLKREEAAKGPGLRTAPS